MTDIELDEPLQEKTRKLRWNWVFPLFFKPRRTLEEIGKEEKGVWLTPLLILSVLAILVVLVAGPIRTQAALGGGELPADFEYWMPEQQEQYLNSQTSMNGPLFVYVFPAVGALAGIWVRWFLLGSILHLLLTLAGSRSGNTAALNLVAWASLPYAVRSIVQIVSMLATRGLINKPGLSGFAAADASGLAAFLGALLVFIDIYLIWQVILLLIGVLPMSRLSRGKAWAFTLLAVLIVLALAALPGFISAQFSGGGGGSSPIFFF